MIKVSAVFIITIWFLSRLSAATGAVIDLCTTNSAKVGLSGNRKLPSFIAGLELVAWYEKDISIKFSI